MKKLSDKVIVITGGSMGIGLEVAKQCVAEGAKVVIAARDEGSLKTACSLLDEVSSCERFSYRLDIGSYQEVKSFASWCGDKFGAVYGLVNCAGIYGPIGKTYKIDIAKFAKTIQINFLGVVHTCHAFIPLMHNWGQPLISPEKLVAVPNYTNYRKKIINYSGGGAATPFPNYSAYATSKIATVRFTENLSIELADESFDVNCIAPGFVITRLHQDTIVAGPDGATKAFYENTKKQLDNGGISAAIPAGLTVFLLSAESDGITGKFISAQWDPWRDKTFQDRLRADKDFATIRRIDDKTFFKKV